MGEMTKSKEQLYCGGTLSTSTRSFKCRRLISLVIPKLLPGKVELKIGESRPLKFVMMPR
jgi:hypothetical protein